MATFIAEQIRGIGAYFKSAQRMLKFKCYLMKGISCYCKMQSKKQHFFARAVAI